MLVVWIEFNVPEISILLTESLDEGMIVSDKINAWADVLAIVGDGDMLVPTISSTILDIESLFEARGKLP